MESALPRNVPAQSNRARPGILACPVCHASSFSSRFTRNGIAIETCNSCGLLVQSPQPSDDELAAIYGRDYFIGSTENDRFASQFEIVKRATASLQLDEIGAFLRQRGQTPNALKLLEVGCGHGNMLLEARHRGYDVQGLEYSADAAQTANRKLGAEVVRVGAISETSLREQSIDVCILVDVIEHLRNPEAFLRHIRRIMKPGGAIFIATPSADSLSARVLGRYWMEFKPEHLFYFNRNTIKRLLENTGFTEIAVSSGKKVLTLDYVIGHFEKFPVPVISPALRVVRALTPQTLLSRPTKIAASGINVFATKPRET